jgi:hypothetical protein
MSSKSEARSITVRFSALSPEAFGLLFPEINNQKRRLRALRKASLEKTQTAQALFRSEVQRPQVEPFDPQASRTSSFSITRKCRFSSEDIHDRNRDNDYEQQQLLRDVNLFLFVNTTCEKDNSADNGYDRAHTCQDSVCGSALRSGSFQENDKLIDRKDGGGDANDQT